MKKRRAGISRVKNSNMVARALSVKAAAAPTVESPAGQSPKEVRAAVQRPEASL
jgi:hypothetical protein